MRARCMRDACEMRARCVRDRTSDEHARSPAELVDLAQLLVLETLLGGVRGGLGGVRGGGWREALLEGGCVQWCAQWCAQCAPRTTAPRTTAPHAHCMHTAVVRAVCMRRSTCGACGAHGGAHGGAHAAGAAAAAGAGAANPTLTLTLALTLPEPRPSPAVRACGAHGGAHGGAHALPARRRQGCRSLRSATGRLPRRRRGSAGWWARGSRSQCSGSPGQG